MASYVLVTRLSLATLLCLVTYSSSPDGVVSFVLNLPAQHHFEISAGQSSTSCHHGPPGADHQRLYDSSIRKRRRRGVLSMSTVDEEEAIAARAAAKVRMVNLFMVSLHTCSIMPQFEAVWPDIPNVSS